MKRKFSLNALLHNERVMFIVSLVAAIVIWALVSFGPANIQERTITITQQVNMTGTIAGDRGLRVVGNDTFTFTVTVRGPRSVIFNLNPDDIAVRAAVDDISGAGATEVAVSAGKIKGGDYSILSVSPSSVTVTCDFWGTNKVPLSEIDVSSVKTADAEHFIGEPLPDSRAVFGNSISIEGPQATVARVSRVRLVVQEGGTISKTTRFKGVLQALDASGNPVDITGCKFINANADNTLDVTVPVVVHQKVTLSCQLLNKPSGLSENGLVTIDPAVITLVGESPSVVEAATAAVANLGTLDFDDLDPTNPEQTIKLNLPSGVSVLEKIDAVTVRVATDGFTKKELSVTLSKAEDIKVINAPAGKTFVLSDKQTLSGIVVCGPSASVRRVTARDLVITLDADGAGASRHDVRITVPKYSDVWVYYDDDGYTVAGQFQ